MNQHKFGTNFLFIVFISLLSFSCSIYTSSDRKKFETDTASLEFFEQLSSDSCSNKSLNAYSTSTKEVYTTESSQDGSPLLVRQLLVKGQLVYETDNLKGVYCVYQNH